MNSVNQPIEASCIIVPNVQLGSNDPGRNIECLVRLKAKESMHPLLHPLCKNDSKKKKKNDKMDKKQEDSRDDDCDNKSDSIVIGQVDDALSSIGHHQGGDDDIQSKFTNGIIDNKNTDENMKNNRNDRVSRNSRTNRVEGGNSSPKEVIIEKMSKSICNKGKKTSTPLFPVIYSSSSISNDSRSTTTTTTTTMIDLNTVPSEVSIQQLTGRWVACDDSDDIYRFQEIMIKYDRDELKAYKLDRNDFIEANEISWKINLKSQNISATKKIRVGSSYVAEVQVALPKNIKPEFIAYSFKLHALPLSTFLSKSESLHYHNDQDQHNQDLLRPSSSSSSIMSSLLSSSDIYYEIELELKSGYVTGKKASHTSKKISYCRTADMDRCLFDISNRGVTTFTPVKYLNILKRDKLPDMLEPASTIDIAWRMATDLESACRMEQISKDILYWKTISRHLKK